MSLLIALSALAAYMCFLFAVSQVRGDNGTADIGYGIGFIVAAAAAYLSASPSLWGAAGLALTAIWGVRLAVRIYRKNRGKSEDFRYRAWRDAWGKWFVLRSFFQVYMLQGLVIYAVVLPVLLVIIYPAQATPLAFLGLILWVIGFYFEAKGDSELDSFLANPENKGRIMREGLWYYTRHPNYFGESLMWWGLAVVAAGASLFPLWGFVSPILITYLLLKVSGVPMLEKRWEGNPEWEDYKSRTSVFIPMPPGK